VATAIAGGIAWATIPAANGVIKGCYQKNNGQLRVVDSADACTSAELPIQWNQNGPKGATGAKGATGTKGATGLRGPQGPTGARGATGLQGSQGLKGDSGANGTTGARGATGTTGDRGLIGPAGPTGPAGDVPVTPPSPWSTRTGNQSDSSFSLELESGDVLRVTSFAGCLPTTIAGRPASCYFTIRGLPDSLANWLNDSLDGNPDAVQDLTVRGPFAPFSGTPAVQFRLHNAFVTKASIALDATSNDVGDVELVVATNTFQSETPTSAPLCDCSNVFFQGDFSLVIEGVGKSGVVAIDGLGFSVPRLGSTTYVPGTPSIDDLRVGVSSSNTPGSTTTRTFFTTWANNVAQGNTDQRDGTVELLNSSLNELAHIDISNLEPLTLFDPMTVDGAQSITFSADHLEYHP
jgi:hypothetical protein